MSFTRARSLRLLPMTLVSSSRLVKFLNLFWKDSPDSERSSSARSSVVRSRRSLAFISPSSSNEHAGGHRQLVRRQAECLARDVFGDAGDFVHHAARLDDRGPLFRGSLAATHADFERLPRDRVVGENADPELAGALHVSRDRHAGRFDLTRREASGLERLEAKVTEREVRTAPREAAVVALLHLSEFRSFRRKHRRSSSFSCGASGDPAGFSRHDFTLEHPDLDSNDAVGRLV